MSIDERLAETTQEPAAPGTDAQAADALVAEYSLKRVVKEGFQNMKDDIDPVYKGAKMGLFSLHAIPTWARQYKEGKLSNDSRGVAAITGLFVAGCGVLGYGIATKEAIEREGEAGYAMLGIPLLAQGVSYTIEAFRRAHKSELRHVVMTKVQSTFANPSGEYDLTNRDLVARVADELYRTEEKETKRNIEQLQERKNNHEPNLGYAKQLDEQIADAKKALEEYKPRSLDDGRLLVARSARRAFNGMFADGNVGKEYQMGVDLLTGPKKRQRDTDNDDDEWEQFPPGIRSYARTHGLNTVAKIVNDTIREKGGSANIELFGRMTLRYDQEKQQNYTVDPSPLWKR